MANAVLTKNEKFQPGYRGVAYPEDVMTVENTIVKIAIAFAVLVMSAAVGWFGILIAGQAFGTTFVAVALPTSIIVALVIGLVCAFKKEPSVPLIMAYAVVEGLVVGAISSIMEMVYAGVVVQALLATFAVIAAVLILFASGKVRATTRGKKIFGVLIVGYLIFSVGNLLLSSFGVIEGAFGIYSAEIYGIPVGLLIGVFAVLLASYSLVIDFDYIKQGAINKLPERYGWTGAFSVMVTVVWLYLEILRIIALTRR